MTIARDKNKLAIWAVITLMIGIAFTVLNIAGWAENNAEWNLYFSETILAPYLSLKAIILGFLPTYIPTPEWIFNWLAYGLVAASTFRLMGVIFPYSDIGSADPVHLGLAFLLGPILPLLIGSVERHQHNKSAFSHEKHNFNYNALRAYLALIIPVGVTYLGLLILMSDKTN